MRCRFRYPSHLFDVLLSTSSKGTHAHEKILNEVPDYVDEMLDGMVFAHPDIYLQPEPRVITRAAGSEQGATGSEQGRVAIVTGGGSGHLPVFCGYVGTGLLHAAAIGDVFASPSAEKMAAACRLAHRGAGVLMLYGNYGGDLMNFGMASELLEFEDNIETTQVLIADDVASAPPEEAGKRRGVAGMVYAFKIAGAAAEQGLGLSEVTRIAQHAADSCRSIGIALTPCVVPRAGKPTFSLGEMEMEMGIGIHGEPGIWRAQIRSADEILDEMLDRLLADQPLSKDQRVSVLVNSLGATPPEELYILYRRVRQRLDALGVTIVMPLVGRYATSMEMAGASLTVCRLDEELERLLLAPCHCAFWSMS